MKTKSKVLSFEIGSHHCPSEDIHTWGAVEVGFVCHCATWQISVIRMPYIEALDIEGHMQVFVAA